MHVSKIFLKFYLRIALVEGARIFTAYFTLATPFISNFFRPHFQLRARVHNFKGMGSDYKSKYQNRYKTESEFMIFEFHHVC